MWLSIPKACTLIVILLLHVKLSLQTTFPTEHYGPCLSRLQGYCNSTTPPIVGGNCTEAILDGLLDGNGNRALDVNNATAIRFSLCESQCGASQLPFSWAIFFQQFAAWILPSLALISQLPFGSKRRSDDLTSIFLAIGSPTMAGYSLAITVLNTRWITNKFERVRCQNADLAARILPNLQYTPIRVLCINRLLSSLIILRDNDEWWRELNRRIHYKRTWSCAPGANIFWVVIAYIFTLVISIRSLTSDVGSNGQSVGTVWLWLVPVVVGWLQLSPTSDHSHLEEIFDYVNDLAHVQAQAWPNAIKASSLGRLRAISIDTLPSETLFSSDEDRSPPIFNYARFFPWSQSAEIIYDAFCSADSSGNARSLDNMDIYISRRAPGYKWASGVRTRMMVASITALALQWGTTGASIFGEILSPTTGLGCRSLAYVIYGSVSTLVWMLLIISSILAHHSSSISPFNNPFSPFNNPLSPSFHRNSPFASLDLPQSHRIAASVADRLCWLGKVLAVFNAIGIIAVGIFQFSNVFDVCYCSASVLGRGRSAAFVTVDVDSSFVETGWVGGLVLASTACFGFIFFVNVMR